MPLMSVPVQTTPNGSIGLPAASQPIGPLNFSYVFICGSPHLTEPHPQIVLPPDIDTITSVYYSLLVLGPTRIIRLIADAGRSHHLRPFSMPEGTCFVQFAEIISDTRGYNCYILETIFKRTF